MPELTAPFIIKNDEKRIVNGPVLIPNEADSDNDVVTEEQIENVAHSFVEQYGNIDLMHSLNNVGRLVESYILPMDYEVDKDTVVPKGSWMLGVRVTDDESWQAVKDGKLGGFSIMAMQKTAMKSSEKKDSSKRVTLSDLGEDWIVNAVSLVDEPAVPKAKWIAIKSKDSESDENVVQKAIDGSMEHVRLLLRRKLDDIFENENQFPVIHSTLDDSLVFRLVIHEKEEEKYFQVGYSIDENGKVEFTDELQEVRIEETVVPITESNPSNPLNFVGEEASINSKEDDGLMSKVMKAFGFASSEKAGKVISNNNLKKLREAKDVIDDLLAIGEKEREAKSKKNKEGSNMNEEEVKELIEKSIEPIDSKMDDILNTMKSSVDEEQEGEEEQEDVKDEKDNTSQKSKGSEELEDDKKSSEKQDDKSFEEKYNEVLKELEEAKKQKPFSKRIAGQDGLVDDSAEKSTDETRNAFGYKVK